MIEIKFDWKFETHNISTANVDPTAFLVLITQTINFENFHSIIVLMTVYFSIYL